MPTCISTLGVSCAWDGCVIDQCFGHQSIMAILRRKWVGVNKSEKKRSSQCRTELVMLISASSQHKIKKTNQYVNAFGLLKVITQKISKPT